ncbi:TorF family putative porin [Hyphomicrobium sp.]|jgi:uncharacterized protein (TIGR02001 family)|uniref:TorF family putative porin n=1 Tax=Hyphomicrobium sp. TaxID=82 RepID=UPI002CA09FD4|nr:TorF family putative porin [Hyphomicrobium sp.]HVZ04135.1 TorF family putative porin [Hyphomicrobium sp.]
MTNIKSFLGAAGVAALATLAMSTAALADDDGDRKFGYSITLSGVSDYLFRGVSLTDNKPAFQPFVEFTYGIAYLDFWGSNVDNGIGDPFEMDIYAGIRPTTGPISWDIGALYYTNPDNSAGWGATDYFEFKVGASVSPVKNLTLGVTGYITPDQRNYVLTETIEGLVSYELPQFAMFTPTVSGGVGYTNADDAPGFFAVGRDNYTYWNAGLKLSVDKYFMDFRYWDTDLPDVVSANGTHHLADGRFLFTAGVNLP